MSHYLPLVHPGACGRHPNFLDSCPCSRGFPAVPLLPYCFLGGHKKKAKKGKKEKKRGKKNNKRN